LAVFGRGIVLLPDAFWVDEAHEATTDCTNVFFSGMAVADWRLLEEGDERDVYVDLATVKKMGNVASMVSFDLLPIGRTN